MVSDVGVDQNVFNTYVNPRSDFTTALGPGVSWWLQARRLRVSATNTGQYLFFETYESQRGWNTTNRLKAELVLGRLTPFATGSYQNARNRQGYEIDARIRARSGSAIVGTELRLSRKTTLVLSEEHEQIRFDDGSSGSLVDELNRRTASEHVQWRQAVTPLTTFVVKADAIRDRFDINGERDANSIRVMPGFEFKPFAVISGTAFVGFRALNPARATVPDYRGGVAAVSADYAIRATRFTALVNRDLSFSFSRDRPYYALTDLGLGITRRVTNTWDARVQANRQTLAYRIFAATSGSERPTEHGVQLSAGVGYRVGVTTRLGVDATYGTRDSSTSERTFRGFRMGASINYGLPQGMP